MMEQMPMVTLQRWITYYNQRAEELEKPAPMRSRSTAEMIATLERIRNGR